MIVRCIDIQVGSIWISVPGNSTSLLDFKFLVDNVVQCKVVPSFRKLDCTKHIKLSFGIDLKFDVAIASSANDIACFKVENYFAVGIRCHIKVQIERNSSQVNAIAFLLIIQSCLHCIVEAYKINVLLLFGASRSGDRNK